MSQLKHIYTINEYNTFDARKILSAIKKIPDVKNALNNKDVDVIVKPFFIVRYPFVDDETKLMIAKEFFLQPLYVDILEKTQSMLKIIGKTLTINIDNKIIGEVIDQYIIKDPDPRAQTVKFMDVLREISYSKNNMNINIDLDYIRNKLTSIFLTYPYLGQKFTSIKNRYNKESSLKKDVAISLVKHIYSHFKKLSNKEIISKIIKLNMSEEEKMNFLLLVNFILSNYRTITTKSNINVKSIIDDYIESKEIDTTLLSKALECLQEENNA